MVGLHIYYDSFIQNNDNISTFNPKLLQNTQEIDDVDVKMKDNSIDITHQRFYSNTQPVFQCCDSCRCLF